MNKEQLNSLALKINSGYEVSDLDLYKLAGAAGVDYFLTFKGVEYVSGDLLNQMLNLAHKNNKVELTKKRVATNQVKITGTHEQQIKAAEELGKRAERLTNEISENSHKRYDRIATEMWKSRKKNKEVK